MEVLVVDARDLHFYSIWTDLPYPPHFYRKNCFHQSTATIFCVFSNGSVERTFRPCRRECEESK